MRIADSAAQASPVGIAPMHVGMRQRLERYDSTVRQGLHGSAR